MDKDNSEYRIIFQVIYSVSLTPSSFIKRVSDTYQTDEPLQFYGGIVADPMGLGKTLSMISLIASDIDLDHTDPSSLSGADTEESSGRTLVIVPPPCKLATAKNSDDILTLDTVLSTWEEQLTEYTIQTSCCAVSIDSDTFIGTSFRTASHGASITPNPASQTPPNSKIRWSY